MAKKTTVVLVDDFTGEELADGKGATLTFGLEGRDYEIDLSPEKANELRGILTPYIAAGRRVGRAATTSRKTSSTSNGEQSAARAWLIKQGVEVSSRGRIPAELMERYRSR